MDLFVPIGHIVYCKESKQELRALLRFSTKDFQFPLEAGV